MVTEGGSHLVGGKAAHARNCERRGALPHYPAGRAPGGTFTVAPLLDLVAADCPKRRNPIWYDRCGAHCPICRSCLCRDDRPRLGAINTPCRRHRCHMARGPAGSSWCLVT